MCRLSNLRLLTPDRIGVRTHDLWIVTERFNELETNCQEEERVCLLTSFTSVNVCTWILEIKHCVCAYINVPMCVLFH